YPVSFRFAVRSRNYRGGPLCQSAPATAAKVEPDFCVGTACRPLRGSSEGKHLGRTVPEFCGTVAPAWSHSQAVGGVSRPGSPACDLHRSVGEFWSVISGTSA